MNQNLFHLLQQHFPEDPNAPALILDEGDRISYEALDIRSGQIANMLAELAIKPGDRVAVQVEKTPEAVMLYLGCLRAGAIYLPLNTAYTDSEVDYFLGDATPSLVVCDPEREDGIAPLARAAGARAVLTLDDWGEGSFIDDAVEHDPDFKCVERAADDVAAILYTSGTTGHSKGAMLTHENLSSNALALHKLWRWKKGDVLLHALPIFHVHGLFVALHCAFLNGSPSIFLPKFDYVKVLKHLKDSTVFMGVPTFYKRLLELTDIRKSDCKKMRLFTAGSAPLLDDTFNEFMERTGHPILERYGMTEAGMITSNPYKKDARIAGTVGLAMPDTKIRITDEGGNSLPDGEIGVLEVKGKNVFKGYWNMPEKTASEFRDDGYFITGDLATIDTDGYVRIVGRTKDLIISGGYNVYPKEIEAVLDELEGVEESAVVGAPHDDFGEVPVAFVVREDFKLTEDAIRDAAGEQLASFKVPKSIVFIDELPRNAMGKVQKAELRDQIKN